MPPTKSSGSEQFQPVSLQCVALLPRQLRSRFPEWESAHFPDVPAQRGPHRSGPPRPPPWARHGSSPRSWQRVIPGGSGGLRAGCRFLLVVSESEPPGFCVQQPTRPERPAIAWSCGQPSGEDRTAAKAHTAWTGYSPTMPPDGPRNTTSVDTAEQELSKAGYTELRGRLWPGQRGV